MPCIELAILSQTYNAEESDRAGKANSVRYESEGIDRSSLLILDVLAV
jgi:hypothetical protein